jgi:hypothetical protein
MKYTTRRDPTKFPVYTKNQFFNIASHLDLPFKHEMTIRLFPVNNSAPAIITIINPVVNIAPARAFANPTEPIVCIATLDPSAAKAMNAPAIMPRANSFAAVKLVFLHPVSMKLTAFSEGLRKDFSIHTSPCDLYDRNFPAKQVTLQTEIHLANLTKCYHSL